MKKLLSIALGLLLTVAAGAATDSNYLFRMLDASSGLPENNVRNVMMLPSGLMCIQGPSAISLYNGAVSSTYRFDPARISYMEFSGMTHASYVPSEEMVYLSTRDHIWGFSMKEREFVYDVVDEKVVRLFVMDDGTPIHFSRDGESEFGDLPGLDGAPVAIGQKGNRMWILSREGRLLCYDIGMNAVSRTVELGKYLGSASSSQFEMAMTHYDGIYLMSDHTVLRYDIDSDKVAIIDDLKLQENDLFTTIAVDDKDNLWVGTARSGVSIVYRDGSTYSFPYLETTGGKRVLHHSDISKIYTDARGGVWIATLTEGLLYYHQDIIRIDTVNSSSLTSGTMPDESIKCLSEAPDGNVLLGTVHGLLEYNPEDNSVSLPYPRLRDEIVISLKVDSKDRIWVGTFYNGLYCIDKGAIRHYTYDSDTNVEMSYLSETPNLNCVRALAEDADGRFWISVYGGLGSFDPETGDIDLLRDRHPELSRYMLVRDILIRQDGSILASGDNGRFIYRPKDDSLDQIDDRNLHSRTNQAFVDHRGLTWIAESSGLSVMDPTGSSRVISDRGIAMAVVEDDMGNIWFSSFNNISRIRPFEQNDGAYRYAMTTFGEADGVDCGAFFQNSILKHSSGEIYMGGSAGLCRFNPADLSLSVDNIAPSIFSVSANGESMRVEDGVLTLKHDQNSIDVEFTNLNYANPLKSSYRYRLEPLDKDWTYIFSTALGHASYTYLSHGTYTLSLQAAGDGMDWSDTTSLRIEIKPPFWQSNLAYFLYFAALLLLAMCVMYLLYHRQTKRLQRENEKEKARKEQELREMKLRFFTNISHELRTPLSLILLPMEGMQEELKGTPHEARLDIMHRNAEQLLGLVNQILDFKKLDEGSEKLSLKTGDFSEFVKNAMESFRGAAEGKGLTLSFKSSMTNPICSFDSDKMIKVVNNLMSNAIKFTESSGKVSVSVSEDGDMAILRVEDTGKGIPEGDLPHIFERFYRSANADSEVGSGIGLHMVKDYVEMHGGSIEVASKLGKGSSFTVSIPSIQSTSDLPVKGDAAVEDNRKRVMVVDDNADFRKYMVAELSSEYAVTEAVDGDDCLSRIGALQPDVLVCDVMMPGKDGFEVTKAVKENVATSHIPVILCTARMSEDVRTEGYENGADAYISKPFKMEMLKARIRNLIEDREKLRQSFTGKADVSPMQLTITTVDQKLVARITECIEKNMDNGEYSVVDLAADTGMHRMNLYRKIQSLFGMTPSEFIRTMRLKRAAQILSADSNINISEVAYMVGFNTVKYFTRYFKEMFGVVPSQYRQENQQS